MRSSARTHRFASVALALALTAAAAWFCARSIAPAGVPIAPAIESAELDEWTRADGERATIDLWADGRVRLEGRVLDAEEATDRAVRVLLADRAAEMPVEQNLPAGPLRIRAEGSTSWERVMRVIETCTWRGVAFWRLQLAARRGDPPRAARLDVALPQQGWIHGWSGTPPSERDPVLRVLGAHRYELEGRSIDGLDALERAVGNLPPPERDAPEPVVRGAEGVSWQDVLEVIALLERRDGWFWVEQVPMRRSCEE